MIDVFSVIPQETSVAGSRIQSRDQLHSAGIRPGHAKDLGDSKAGKHGQEIYKSVRWTRPDSLSIKLDKDQNEAAKAAMG